MCCCLHCHKEFIPQSFEDVVRNKRINGLYVVECDDKYRYPGKENDHYEICNECDEDDNIRIQYFHEDDSIVDICLACSKDWELKK